MSSAVLEEEHVGEVSESISSGLRIRLAAFVELGESSAQANRWSWRKARARSNLARDVGKSGLCGEACELPRRAGQEGKL
jgi:hypothetical protein